MKYTAAIVLASAAVVSADCSVTSFEENGNWFCQAVSLIKYEGLDTTGTYSAVSAMNTDGTCSFEDKAYSGSIAPFDEELSVHVRGPAQLKQFAVYTAGSSSTKKRQEHKSHHKRHGHQHLHKKHTESKQEAARAVGDIVTAVIDGETVTWTNTYSGENGAVNAVNAAAAVETSSSKTTASAKSSTTKTKTSSTTTSTSVASGDYTRVAYYNAEDATADGLTFLGTYGGTGSGVWDTTYGSSLSYLSADGTTGAESSTVLDNVLVGDNIEYIITSDTECTSDGADCGFYRDGTVAYQGFAGADKVFLFEFTMPLTGNTDWNCDMPAIWLLNAKIPRTQQYGDCSCWGSNGRGCGEADLFEVLATGDTKAKSTFHFLNALGSSDYFDRPTSDYIKLAAVFRSSDSTASIKVLDSSVDFSSSLTADTVDSFIVEDSSSLLSSIEDFLSSL
ncbi:hypothetical protein SCUP234_08066 [Seiridium cupressi]